MPIDTNPRLTEKNGTFVFCSYYEGNHNEYRSEYEETEGRQHNVHQSFHGVFRSSVLGEFHSH